MTKDKLNQRLVGDGETTCHSNLIALFQTNAIERLAVAMPSIWMTITLVPFCTEVCSDIHASLYPLFLSASQSCAVGSE